MAMELVYRLLADVDLSGDVLLKIRHDDMRFFVTGLYSEIVIPGSAACEYLMRLFAQDKRAFVRICEWREPDYVEPPAWRRLPVRGLITVKRR